MSKRFAHVMIVSVIVLGCLMVTVARAQEPAASKPAQAQQATGPFPPNVRVDVTITDQSGTTAPPIKKTVSLTCYRNSSIRSGVRVPVPTTTFGSGDANAKPIAGYNLQNVGLNVDVRDVEVRDNQIRLQLTVEYSPLDETDKPTTGMSSYANFSQAFYLVMENGKPIIAAQTSDPVPGRDRKLSVELKATILK